MSVGKTQLRTQAFAMMPWQTPLISFNIASANLDTTLDDETPAAPDDISPETSAACARMHMALTRYHIGGQMRCIMIDVKDAT